MFVYELSGCGFESRCTHLIILAFARKYKKTYLDTGLDASKRVIHKTVGFLGNKTADAVAKSNDENIVKPDENSRNVKTIFIPPEKGDEISNKLRKVLM